MRVAVSVAWLVAIGLALPGAAKAADPKVEALKESPPRAGGPRRRRARRLRLSGLGPDGTRLRRLAGQRGADQSVVQARIGREVSVPGGTVDRRDSISGSSEAHRLSRAGAEAGGLTLRYGLQPKDGNHVGTADLRDFLVACPPKDDADPKPIEDIKALFKLSMGASGTAHPAIFPLLESADKPFAAPAARHDAEKDLLILETNVAGKKDAGGVMVPIRLVTAGKGES